MIDCALISSDDTFRHHVRSLTATRDAVGRLVVDIPMSADGVARDTLSRVLGGEVRLAFIDLGDELTGIRVLELLSEQVPEMALIVAGPELAADSLLRVIRAGASEYLPRPLDQGEVTEAFNRVRRKLAPLTQDEQASTALVTTFVGAKGGTGVTTLATNTAVALRMLTEQDTLLIDLASSLGTAGLQLGLRTKYSYLDVVQNFHRLDRELLRSFLESHDTGVVVLASPPLADDEESVPTADQVIGLLRVCRRHFGHIVIDAGSRLSSTAVAAMGESDDRFLVANPELPTLRNVRRVLDHLRHLNGKSLPGVVLNRFDDDAGLGLSEVEQALRCDVAHTVESDTWTVREAINMGRPPVLEQKSRFSKDVMAIGREIAGPDRIVLRQPSFLDSILRPFRSRTAPTGEEAS